MAYSEQELQDYWSGVQDGSVMENAAPNSFQGSATFTENQSQDLQDIRDTSYADRQASMDWQDKYKVNPEQAQMLSDRLTGVLEADNPYIQRARTKAQEAAGGRGLLNSSMAAGAAEGAAIDRALDVAAGDVDVDKFNVGALNEAQELRYKAGMDTAGRTQDFLNQLGGAEADYIFDVGLADEKQQDELERMQEEYENKQALQDSAHGQKMESDMLQYTNQRAMEMLKQQSGLYASYLEAYGQIAMADISTADKNSQLSKLGQQIDNAVRAANSYKNITITGPGVPNYDITGV